VRRKETVQEVSSSQETKPKVKGRKALYIAIITIIAWLAIGGVSGPVFSKISSVQENDNSAFLPESAESTIASDVIVKFQDQSAELLPTLILLEGDVGPTSDPALFAKINEYAQTLPEKVLPESGEKLSTYFAPGIPLSVIPSADGKATLINFQINSVLAGESIGEEPALPLLIKFIREDVKQTFEEGLNHLDPRLSLTASLAHPALQCGLRSNLRYIHRLSPCEERHHRSKRTDARNSRRPRLRCGDRLCVALDIALPGRVT